MDNKRRQSLVLVLLAALSLAGWLAGRRLAGVSGFPLDDAWIHQTYARSLANGEGWTFIPGVPSAGATAPLWAMILVPGHWLGAAPFTWVLILAFIQLVLLGLIGAGAWRQMGIGTGWWSVAAGGVLVLEWHLVWGALSGMETLLYGLLALSVIFILLWLRNQDKPSLWKWFGLGLLIGVGVWARPEAVTLLGPVGMVAVLQPEEQFSSRLKKILAAGGGFLLLFGLYLLFNHWLAGSWWPNTFYAKQAEYAVLQSIPLYTRLVEQFSPLMAGVLAVLGPGFLANLYFSFRQRNWAALSGGIWALGHVVMYAWRLPVIYQHGRYVIPALPLLLLLGLAGTFQLVSSVSAERVRWLLGRVWGGAVVCILGLFWLMGMQSYLDDVAMIDGEMVQTAAWIAENTASDDLIAAHDIGALGYFTRRPLLDLAGLVSPDVIQFMRDEEKLAEYLNRECPQYLVTFPDWYEQLPQMGTLVFQTETQITLEQGGSNMAVYRWVGDGSCP